MDLIVDLWPSEKLPVPSILSIPTALILLGLLVSTVLQFRGWRGSGARWGWQRR
jgi:hypothetical protein